jgi:hypothetical protein
MLVDALAHFAGLPADPGVMGVSEATGHHPGGEHHARPWTGAATDEGNGLGTQPVEGSRQADPIERVAVKETSAPVPPGDATAHTARRPWKLLRRNGERGSEV